MLDVGGMNWALMFERSSNWAKYGLPLKGSYNDLLDAVIMEQALQMALIPVDGGTIAGVTLPGTPAKQFLMHTSVNDTEVPNVGSFYQARSYGVTLISPSVLVPYGFESKQATSGAGGWIIADEKPDAAATDDKRGLQLLATAAHENVRRRALIQQQMRDFWATGTVTNTCTGVCDCAAGNCGPLRTPMYGGH